MDSKESDSRRALVSNELQEEESTEYAMQLVSASVLPMVLKAAIDLGVLQIISNAGPCALLSPSQIVSRLPSCSNPDAPSMLDRLLRLLASHSILSCSLRVDDHGKVERLYGLLPVSKHFVPNQDGASLACFLDMVQDKVMVNMWYNLKDAILEGGLPFDRAYQMNLVEYVGKDARLPRLFRGFTTDYNSLFTRNVLDKYKGFQDVKTLVDVGGGDGSILNLIISKYPTIKGINFDMPQVIEKAPSFPGVENVAGDMFDSIPRGDAIFLKWILHSWDDKNCVKILKKCHEALPENGKVMVVELVVPEVAEDGVAMKSLFQLETFMMSMRPGGKERTEREFQSLGKEAGFSGFQLACSAYSFSLLEFHKSM